MQIGVQGLMSNTGKKIRACKTKTEQKNMESQFGCRYSVFVYLPYFNSSRFLIVDPMHNLFLGTWKRMINLWMEFNLLTSNHFLQVQSFVDNITVPSDVGRIPHKSLVLQVLKQTSSRPGHSSQFQHCIILGLTVNT